MLSNVLLVDRDFHVGEIVADSLDERGIRTTWVASVTQGIPALRRGAPPDLLLMEYRPPEGGGLQVVEEAVALCVPFCLLSCEMAISDLMRAHAVPVLCKPFGPLALAEAIEAALRRRGSLGTQLAQLRHLDAQLRGRAMELEYAA